MPRKSSKAKSVAPVPLVAEQTYSASEIARTLFELVPEIEETGLSQADTILALEDRGWIGGAQSWLLKGELSPYQRRNIILECRMYWQQDPLAKQAVRVRTDYAVGTGVTYQCDDDAATIKLDAFWKNRKNKKLTTSRGQQSLMKKLLVDGELFFAVFTDGDVPVLRTIDCLQITDFISDPQDEQEVLCYKRVYGQPGKEQETLYYKDWAADDDDLEGLKDPENGKEITLESNVVIYHLPYDDLGKRGNSLLSSVIYWTRQHRHFMESRVALLQALAKFAHKLTTKGGQNVVNAIADRLNKGTDSSGTRDARGDGSTFVQNAGIDLQPMPRSTGAGDARSDGDMLKLMICAGTDTMLHYFGDPSTGNLATAEAMELPMLKSFTGDQELWKDCWRDIFSLVLEEDIDTDPEAIKVHMPPMLKDDLNKMGTFLMGMHQVFPEIQVDSILEMALIALGCPNVDETMAEIGKKRDEMAQQQQELMKAAQSPLGNQLPQPSIKVSKFQAAPTKANESLASAVEAHKRYLESRPKHEPVKESISLGEVLQSFAQQLEDVRQEISEGRKRDQQNQERETNERERALELAKLEWQESQSVAALNRLCQVIEKEPAPLLSESTIHRLLEGSKSKAIKMEKTGEISRDPATGKMRFVMQETPIEEANT